MTNDLVSIIIPVYNVANYLDRCIESACNQTYKNVEIILVDDGSTDDSPRICDDWAKKDSRIKVIHKENGGVSSARNAGLDVAEGKFVSFLDGDDEYVDDTVETALNYYADDVDLVSFGYTIISSDKKDEILFREKTYINTTEEDRFNFIIGPFFRFEIGWSVCCNFFLKSIIEKYNISFQNGHKMAEDKAFCLCYFSHCTKITCIGISLYNYYMRNDSATHVLALAAYYGEKVELSKAVLNHYRSCKDCKEFINRFSLICYMIFERDLQSNEASKKHSVHELREAVLNDIKEKSDIDFFIANLKKFKSCRWLLNKEYDSLHIFEKSGRVQWLLSGCSFWYTVLVRWRKSLENIFKNKSKV